MQTKINTAQEAYGYWKATPLASRIEQIQELRETLHRNRLHYATLITQEMGKPIVQALAEVDKCGLLCEYYAAMQALFFSQSRLPPTRMKVLSLTSP